MPVQTVDGLDCVLRLSEIQSRIFGAFENCPGSDLQE